MKILKRNQIIISVIALMLITVGYMNYTSNITATLETGVLMDAEQVAGIGDAKLVNSNNVVENEEGSSSGLVENTDENSQDNSDVSSQNSSQNNSVNIETAESSTTGEYNSTSTNTTSASSTSENSESASSMSTDNQTKSESQTTSANNYETEYFVSSRLERDKMYSQMIETYQGMLESSTVSAEQKSISTQEITNINNKKNSIMIAENLIKNLGFEDVVIFVNEESVSVIVKTEKLEEAQIAQIQNIVCREIGVEAEMIHISLK